jgi:hypothetical protein
MVRSFYAGRRKRTDKTRRLDKCSRAEQWEAEAVTRAAGSRMAATRVDSREVTRAATRATTMAGTRADTKAATRAGIRGAALPPRKRFTEKEGWRASGKLLEEKLVGRAGNKNGPKVEFLKLII